MRIVVASISLLLALAVAGAAQASGRPALRAASLAPLVLRGTGFQPHERVWVAVFAPRRAKRAVVASAAGSFTARFGFAVGRCARASAQAFGANGSRARLLPTGIGLDCEPTGLPTISVRKPIGVGGRR